MKKYLVIGNPIEHSLSPLLHNFWLKKHGIDAIYERQLVEKNDVEKIINDIRDSKIQGINVTVPFKKEVIPFLDHLSDTAQKSQSVNTIFKRQNKLVGDNTDVYGFSQAIKLTNFNLKNKKVLILGAGGVVPSIILALKNMGILEIVLSNRTKAKAESLEKSFPFLKVINWGETIKSDLIINATSLGLKNGNDFNFSFDDVKKTLIYIDTIYNPLETKTIKYLKEKETKVFNGLEMFIYQGQKSFYLWNKINPEIDQNLIELLLSKLK